MTATVFSSPEPELGIVSSDAPMVVGNPALIRRAEVRRKPAWMIAAPVAVAALAAVGIVVAVGNHHAQPASQQVAQAAPAPTPPPIAASQDTPAPPAALSVVPAPAAIPPAAVSQRLAVNQAANVPAHHKTFRSRTEASSAMNSAADASATAPVAPARTAAAPSVIQRPMAAQVAPTSPPVIVVPAAPPVQLAPPAAATPSPDAPQT
jgi:hypothetical protein